MTVLFLMADLASGVFKIPSHNFEMPIKNNTLIVMKSRKVSWAIEEVKQKVLVLSMKISGPCDGSY